MMMSGTLFLFGSLRMGLMRLMRLMELMARMGMISNRVRYFE